MLDVCVEKIVTMSDQSKDRKRTADQRSPLAGRSKVSKTEQFTIPSETPEWAKKLFEAMLVRIKDLEEYVDFISDDSQEALEKSSAMDRTIRDIDIALTNRINSIERQLKDSNKQQKELKNKVLNLETYSRRDNILVFGLEESEGENDLDCLRKVKAIFKSMGVEDVDGLKITRCHRKGPYNREKTRPVIVRFLLPEDRNKVWAKKTALKDINKKVFITEDYPSEIEARRRKLWPIYKAAREVEAFKGKVKMNGDKLIINSTVYTVDNLDLLPPAIHPWKLSSRSDDDSLAFFTSLSPLSNHYPCTFTVDSITYNCIEQYLMCQKALTFNDRRTADQIRATSDPVTQKYLGSQVSNFKKSDWELVAPRIIQKGHLEKFKANATCRLYLMSTGSKRLGEAAGPKETLFGIGMSLKDEDVLKTDKWSGSNVQGESLMWVRNELRKMPEYAPSQPT